MKEAEQHANKLLILGHSEDYVIGDLVAEFGLTKWEAYLIVKELVKKKFNRDLKWEDDFGGVF